MQAYEGEQQPAGRRARQFAHRAISPRSRFHVRQRRRREASRLVINSRSDGGVTWGGELAEDGEPPRVAIITLEEDSKRDAMGDAGTPRGSLQNRGRRPVDPARRAFG